MLADRRSAGLARTPLRVPRLATFVLLAAVSAGTSSAATLCFDEGHHNVHTSTGGYAPFAELAGREGFRIASLPGKWTSVALAACDLVISVSPRGASREESLKAKGAPAFASGEVDAVEAWIRHGGGLLLVTDHAPIGAATAPLSRRLGVDMSNAFTEDPAHFDEERGCLVFSRQNGLLASHPVTEGGGAEERVDAVGMFLGQSLAGPPGSASLLTLGPDARDRFRRSRGRLWLEPSAADLLRPAGGRSQAVAFDLGGGRVVVLADAAALTDLGRASGFGVPGLDNERFAVNILHWLSSRRPAEPVPEAAVAPVSRELVQPPK